MKRPLFTLLFTLLAGGALTLGACGGGDDSPDDQGAVQIQQAPPAGPTPATGSPGRAGDAEAEGGKSNRNRRQKRSRSNRGGGSTGKSTQADQGSVLSGTPSKKYEANTSYRAAQEVCRVRDLKVIRSFYKPKGKDDADIARAVARFYKPKHRRDAAYDGCLKGLSQR